MPDPRDWWIVGASEGLGRALASRLDADRASLVLSARNAERLAGIAGGLRDALAVPMDVTDQASVMQAVEAAGPVEGFIYCVGQYEPMSARDWDTESAIAMTEANYIGALRVLGGVLPTMRARDSGRIVLVGSIAGYRGLPGAIGYGASKAALMHLAENLRFDLRGTGIRVQIVNPGFIDTRLTRKNAFSMPSIMSPDIAAGHVVRAIRNGRFSASFPFPFATLFRFSRCLPQWLFDKFF